MLSAYKSPWLRAMLGETKSLNSTTSILIPFLAANFLTLSMISAWGPAVTPIFTTAGLLSFLGAAASFFASGAPPQPVKASNAQIRAIEDNFFII